MAHRAHTELNEYGESENSPCYKFEYAMSLMAETHGLYFKRCSQWHFHLKGVFLLNVYPTVKTVYVQGSNGKTRYKSLLDLIRLANGNSEIKDVKKANRQNLKGKRIAIWNSGLRQCFVCDKPIDTFEDSSIEHKVPLSQGGSNRRDNLTLSHHNCNQKRGSNLSNRI